MGEGDKAKHSDAAAQIIGSVPEQCSLRGHPLWEIHSMSSQHTTSLERRGDAPWPRAGKELLQAALCMYVCMLGSD